jgi:N-acetylmuramoyl-L-alanine amidase
VKDSKGNPLVEDGIMGACTRDAVKRLQNVCGIDVDGKAGPQTWSVINAIFSRPFLKIGSIGIAVRYLQYRVGTSYDGIFGWGTNRAVAIWQGQNGIIQDGEVGPETWNRLLG